MNILIDTHIFIWLLKTPEKITPEQTRQLTMAHAVYLSAVSIAELAIKSNIGKFNLDFDPVEMATQSGLQLMAFDAEDALKLRTLPLHHRDPFDRMLIAQSLNRNIRLMTSDKQFKYYPCKLA